MKKGTVREDGRLFWGNRKGGCGETWLRPAKFHRQKVNVILSNARTRSRKAGTLFDLDREYLESIYPIDGVCPVLDIPMEWGGRTAGTENSPSLDRVDPAKGYTKGNVVWISWRANRLKSDATPDEIARIATYVCGHKKETIH